ncbi:MAG: hypothetical protein ACRDGE_05830 [Candidatus Limnocylindria bacterium]
MPGPRDALPRIVQALGEVFADDLRCVLLKGSVLRGDHIPYFSDLDVHALVEGVGASRAPDWPRGLAFQRLIGGLDPEHFGVGAFQIELLAPGYHREWPTPLPGTYEVLFGEAPRSFAAADPAEHLAAAPTSLARLAAVRDSLVAGLLDKPDRALPPRVRLLGTHLKGALLSAACLLTADPVRAHGSTRHALVMLVGDALGVERELAVFYELASTWRETRTRGEDLRAMWAMGMTTLDALASWVPPAVPATSSE